MMRIFRNLAVRTFLLRTCFVLVSVCILTFATGATSCSQPDQEEIPRDGEPEPSASGPEAKSRTEPSRNGKPEDREKGVWAMKRKKMVQSQIEARGVHQRTVLDALMKVERHQFVPESQRSQSYADYPLPIGENQTISQPYIVALMTELLDPEKDDKILEIGTGSGYQAAILGEIVGEVYTIEIVESLGLRAKALLEELGYENIHVRIGDGYRGWPEEAPFDGIIVTAAPGHIPQPLVDQLVVGGRLVIPVGRHYSQQLQVLEKTPDGLKTRDNIAVRFVPMTGEAMERD